MAEEAVQSMPVKKQREGGGREERREKKREKGRGNMGLLAFSSFPCFT